VGVEKAADSVKQRPTRTDLGAPITESELDEVQSRAKSGKATSNVIAVGLLQACSAGPGAFGLLHGLVSGTF
jgi:hypothetical protein